MAKSRAKIGTDVFREMVLPESGELWTVTYWDIWFLVVLLDKYAGDWDEMLASFEEDLDAFSSRYEMEPKFSHLWRLRAKMQAAGLAPRTVLGDEAETLLKKELPTAVNRIFKRPLQPRVTSEWMVYTLRQQWEEQVLRGRWHTFAVSPEPYAESLTRRFKTRGFYGEDETFALWDKLNRFLKEHEENANVPRLTALYRAFLTVLLEKIDMIDDSYGNIGTLYGEVFVGYVGLPASEMGMSREDYLRDLLQLIVWEDYGFLYDELPAFLASLTPEEAELADSVLQALGRELAGYFILKYQVEKVLRVRGLLAVEQAWLSRFVELARELGSDYWQPIVGMAEKAEAIGDMDLATAVYETAVARPGRQNHYLQKKYDELLARRK